MRDQSRFPNLESTHSKLTIKKPPSTGPAGMKPDGQAGRPVPRRSHHRRNHAVIPAGNFCELPVIADLFGPIVKVLLQAPKG